MLEKLTSGIAPPSFISLEQEPDSVERRKPFFSSLSFLFSLQEEEKLLRRSASTSAEESGDRQKAEEKGEKGAKEEANERKTEEEEGEEEDKDKDKEGQEEKKVQVAEEEPIPELPEEPEASEKGITKIVLRLESGEKHTRRFRGSEPVQALYDLARARGQRGVFVVVTNFPKTVLEDRQVTLEEAGLVPGAAVFVSVS